MAKRTTFRPRLEPLEDRLVPASYAYTGYTQTPHDNVWGDVNAWNNGGGGTPQNGDTVVFAQSSDNMTVPAAITSLGELDIQNVYGGQVQCAGPLTVTGTFNLTTNGGGCLEPYRNPVQPSSTDGVFLQGTSSWSGSSGFFSSDGPSGTAKGGPVRVQSGGALTVSVSGDAVNSHCDFVIGVTGAGGGGTLKQTSANINYDTGNNYFVTVTNGTWEFTTAANSSTGDKITGGSNVSLMTVITGAKVLADGGTDQTNTVTSTVSMPVGVNGGLLSVRHLNSLTYATNNVNSFWAVKVDSSSGGISLGEPRAGVQDGDAYGSATLGTSGDGQGGGVLIDNNGSGASSRGYLKVYGTDTVSLAASTSQLLVKGLLDLSLNTAGTWLWSKLSVPTGNFNMTQVADGSCLLVFNVNQAAGTLYSDQVSVGAGNSTFTASGVNVVTVQPTWYSASQLPAAAVTLDFVVTPNGSTTGDFALVGANQPPGGTGTWTRSNTGKAFNAIWTP